VKRLPWVVVALALFLGTMLVELPASLALRLWQPDGIALQLDDVRGSLWRGRATRLRWHGRELGALSWTLRPGALLRGRVAVDLRLAGEATAQARLVRGWRRTEIHDLDGMFPAHWLRAPFAGGAWQLQGRMHVTVARAVLDGNRVTALAGNLAWQDAALRGMATAALGNLRAPFALAEDHRVHGSIRDDGGPVAVSGEFAADASRYRIRLLLAARNAGVGQLLQAVGQPLADGRRLLVVEQELRGNGAR
jgi:general secretion pathway protein N